VKYGIVIDGGSGHLISSNTIASGTTDGIRLISCNYSPLRTW